MKDKQIAPPSGTSSIFLVSALLHCVSMAALVYLRSSFGFAFLRPKSLFFALTWAFVLYAIYAWLDGVEWQERRGLLLFVGSALSLYWLHLGIAFIREWRQTGEHDHSSGTSHLLRLWGGRDKASGTNLEASIQLWVEPLVVLAVATALRLTTGERTLAGCFGVVGGCLWLKEALNHWFQVRQRKRQRDVYEDAQEAVEPDSVRTLTAEPLKAARKPALKRVRRTADPFG